MRTSPSAASFLPLIVLGLLLPLAAPAPTRGQSPIPLTRHPAADRAPAWSPDGARLAFETDRAGSWDIWTMTADGTEAYALTSGPSEDRHPDWSPDGERVVFGSDRSGSPELWILDLSTDSLRMVAELEGEELHPDWSPDGSRIAFARMRAGEADLWSVAPDGSDLRPLVEGPGRDLWPRWSPDGTRLAFFSRRATDGVDDELHLLELASGEVRRVTERPGHDFCPTWSDDGLRLAAAVVEDGERSLRLFDLEGRATLRYARGFHRATEPAWSPDGGVLAFAGRLGEEEEYEIYTVVVAR